MTYAELIESMRYELSDSKDTEWDTKDLFDFVKRAERRIRMIVIKLNLDFARKAYEFDTVADQPSYDLPDDFDIQNGLYRRDLRVKLDILDTDEWELAPPQSGPRAWMIRGDELLLKDTPQGVISMVLHYFPAYVTPVDVNSEMFFGDKLADPIMLYAAFIAKNVDEADASVDASVVKDIENHILEVYERNKQRVYHLRGSSLS